MTESQPQQGTGKTGGLPGANADPRTAEVPDDQLRDTVGGGDDAPAPDPDPAAESDDDAAQGPPS